MTPRKLRVLIVGEICLLLLLGVFLWGLARQKHPNTMAEIPTAATTAAATTPITTAAVTTQPPSTAAPTETTAATEAATVPAETVYTLTFAGDCTLGTLYEYYSAASSFPGVIGENYSYPFAAVGDWFQTDDFTLVNLEGPLTNEGTPANKTYVMRGDPKLVNILPAGSVECVNLANNHTLDFGSIGYENTKKALDSVQVAYAGDGETVLVETARGLKVGLLSVNFYIDPDRMTAQIAALKEQGAQVVIVSFHWGVEGTYHHTYSQQSDAYAAIDAGANIVFGHHPHVLQEIEEYGGGIIYYSLGNFSFGGNDCPRDFDTALISQQVIVEADGTVRLGQCTPIPCSLSSVSHTNDFQPTPAEPGSDRYTRVLSKLDGSYTGADLITYTPEEETEETETAPASTEASDPPPTEDTDHPGNE